MDLVGGVRSRWADLLSGSFQVAGGTWSPRRKQLQAHAWRGWAVGGLETEQAPPRAVRDWWAA